jgi:hypothetical protein
MPEPTVYWHGSVVAYQTGTGSIQVIWCLNPAEAAPIAPKPKGKRTK